jgi:hypothetical protein
VLVEYPTSSVGAKPDAAVQKFLTDYGGAAQTTATLRGRKLLHTPAVSCMDDANSGRSWCSTTTTTTTADASAQQQGAANNRNLQVVDLDAVTNTVLAITVDFIITNYNFINVTFAAAQQPMVLAEGETPAEIGACEDKLLLVSTVTQEKM